MLGLRGSPAPQVFIQPGVDTLGQQVPPLTRPLLTQVGFISTAKKSRPNGLKLSGGCAEFLQSSERFSCEMGKLGGTEAMRTEDLPEMCFRAVRNPCNGKQSRPTDQNGMFLGPLLCLCGSAAVFMVNLVSVIASATR